MEQANNSTVRPEPRPVFHLPAGQFRPVVSHPAKFQRAAHSSPAAASAPASTHSDRAAATFPDASEQQSNVISLLERGRAAMDGVTRAATWPVSASARLAANLHRWMERQRRAPVDALAQLEAAARYAIVTNRLSGMSALSEQEEAVVRSGTSQRVLHQAGAEIAVEGEASPKPMFLVSGWACRYRVLPNGRTQIIGLLVPGDAIGMKGCAEPMATTNVSALTSVETVDARPLLKMAQQPGQFPGVSHAVSRMCVQEEEFLVNQVIRLGSLPVEGRLAHLLLELRWRLAEAGLASEREFSMPLTNDSLADALGVNPKLIARTMETFRRRKIVRHRYGRVEIIKPKVLKSLSGFRAPETCSCSRLGAKLH
jgi:CRP-like cAMP-binding protein